MLYVTIKTEALQKELSTLFYYKAITTTITQLL